MTDLHDADRATAIALVFTEAEPLLAKVAEMLEADVRWEKETDDDDHAIQRAILANVVGEDPIDAVLRGMVLGWLYATLTDRRRQGIEDRRDSDYLALVHSIELSLILTSTERHGSRPSTRLWPTLAEWRAGNGMEE